MCCDSLSYIIPNESNAEFEALYGKKDYLIFEWSKQGKINWEYFFSYSV